MADRIVYVSRLVRLPLWVGMTPDDVIDVVQAVTDVLID